MFSWLAVLTLSLLAELSMALLRYELLVEDLYG